MDVLAEIWERVVTTQPVPRLDVVLALGVGALVLVGSPAGYRLVRHLVTVVHEAGHAAVAVLAGRRLTGIRLHSDTSGLTVSRGRARGPGMVATLAAGYPAPALLGLAAAWLLSAGYAVGLLWGLVLVCGVLLLHIRNLYGVWVLLATGGAVAAASWWLPPVVLSALAHLLVWALLLSAPRSVLELSRQRRAGRGHSSDADQLARITVLPAVAWVGVFAVVTIGGLVAGGWLLVRGAV